MSFFVGYQIRINIHHCIPLFILYYVFIEGGIKWFILEKEIMK